MVGRGLCDGPDTVRESLQHRASSTRLERYSALSLFARAACSPTPSAEGLAVALVGGQVEPGGQFAMQPVGCPVGAW